MEDSINKYQKKFPKASDLISHAFSLGGLEVVAQMAEDALKGNFYYKITEKERTVDGLDVKKITPSKKIKLKA